MISIDNLASLYNSKQSASNNNLDSDKQKIGDNIKPGLFSSLFRQKLENVENNKRERPPKNENNENENMDSTSRIEMLKSTSRPITPLKNNN